jgi:hypothetical protein
MAKIEGTQTIPSELLEAYRGNIIPATPDGVVRKRNPWHLPAMQEGGAGVSQNQQIQRSRFKHGITLFKTLSTADKQRWYDARPIWGSFLWYYNYFIMSDLSGNANINQGGAGVIKSIQFKTISMPAGTGEGEVAITAVDPAKTVVMLFGSSFLYDDTEYRSFAWPVYPYVSSIAAELVKCKWSTTNYWTVQTAAANIGIIIIEYI